MTTTTRFIPLLPTHNEVASLQQRLNAIFNEFSRPVAGDAQNESSAMGSFVPAVDVYEDAQALVLQLEVPGVKQADLDIRLENQTLTVKGERRLDTAAKQENFHRIERRFGSFVRTFTLPQTVDTETVTASYDAGVLKISLAKKAEAKPRQVKIEVMAPEQVPAQVQAPAQAN
jgi:HSP20 family protein